MFTSILVALLTGSVTTDFCDEPSPGPGGSPITYCQIETAQTVSTPYFSVDLPEGAWLAISEEGRRVDAQPDLSMSMLMLTITLLTPEQLDDYRLKDLGSCSTNAANSVTLCESEVRGDKIVERLIVGKEYSIRVKLVERWSGPLVHTYRSSVASVAIADDL